MAVALSLTDAQRALFFRYDKNLPLEIELGEGAEDNGIRVSRLSLMSIHAERVPLTIWHATSGDAPPVILMQHGAGSHREDAYIRLPALRWARLGFTCVAIDAHAHGARLRTPRDAQRVWQLPWSRKEHAVQMAVDLMRAMDHLETRADIDAARIGFLGFSMGTIMGVPFVGLDKRIKSTCLTIGGSMLGRYAALADSVDHHEHADVSEIIDPVHFAHLIAPRPVLMINGRHDEVVLPEAAECLFAALAEPKRLVWYDGGHTEMRGAQYREMVEFFQTTL